MELKFVQRFSYKLTQLFKSHLYGIEIETEFKARSEIKRLNRTFMELKFRINKVSCKTIETFKSHLYGIEIQRSESANL